MQKTKSAFERIPLEEVERRLLDQQRNAEGKSKKDFHTPQQSGTGLVRRDKKSKAKRKAFDIASRVLS